MARIFPPIATVIVLVALVKAEPLSVPLQEGNVTLVLDGQALPFEVTSGTGRSFAFYGPQYERVYGSDSCETSYYKCYFCPKENPCKDIFERKKWTAEFEDGVYHYVEHNVTLDIGSSMNVWTRRVPNFTIGLVIHFPTPYLRAPMPLLGLSFGRRDIPETFLEQLKRREVISTLSYSLRASEQGPGISGTLTLGDDSEMTDSSYVGFSEDVFVDGLQMAARLGPFTLFDSVGNQLRKPHKRSRPESALVDSGSAVTYIFEEEFNAVMDVTWKGMKKAKTDLKIKKKKLECKGTESDGIAEAQMIRREAVPYLPTLEYQIGDEPRTVNISMEPKHYVHSCEEVCCQMNIAPLSDFFGTTIFGHSLFRAYDVKVEHSSKRIYFSPGQRPPRPSAPPQSTGTRSTIRRRKSLFRRLTLRN
ncbi:hypothetical protein FOZ60_008185 [Perkinsus olseni]|uniref:Peptidase A1 domain-containing protein n=1 Tax=Perkinsus olseni TaxID=32597 RepID=A0A7J6NM13_PEROL|nr:hypothetical protein FOZ60_008185 [Perkinsus olseni]